MTKIVLLHDVYAIKEQKERELAYYREQLEIITEKLIWIEREYKLTKDIIKMIEQETVVAIKPTAPVV
jgi:hypothetical protein